MTQIGTEAKLNPRLSIIPHAGILVAVVVTYNRLDQLKLTLERLLSSSLTDLAYVVVVDNASTDDTNDWLIAQSDTRLDVLRNAQNTGGAGGFEAGMRYVAATYNPDWMLVMDDDGRPCSGALEQFHTDMLQEPVATQPEIWGVAAAVFHPSGKICDINRPSINPFWHLPTLLRTVLGGGRNAFHLGADAFEPKAIKRDVDAASFVGLFVARAGWEAVGFPDGNLFIYGDDVLYTLGLRQAGGRVLFNPSIRFEHDFLTIAKGKNCFHPIWKVYYHHRNLMIVYRRAAGVFFWPALLIILPKWLSKMRHYKGEERVFLALISRAIWHGLRQHTGVAHDQVLAWASVDDK